MLKIIVNNNSSILKTDNKKLLTTLKKKYSAKVQATIILLPTKKVVGMVRRTSSPIKQGSLELVCYLILRQTSLI